MPWVIVTEPMDVPTQATAVARGLYPDHQIAVQRAERGGWEAMIFEAGRRGEPRRIGEPAQRRLDLGGGR